MVPNVILCGAGFLGSHIARALTIEKPASSVFRRVQIASRRSEKIHASLKNDIPDEALLPPLPVDITKPHTLENSFRDAHTVVSLVGVLNGTPKDFETIQWKGAENVARAAKAVGAKLIHVSAIGADSQSPIPYARTKALAEQSVLEICPDATIIRPSIVFGPRDGFFNRFAQLSQFLPFMPVFGGGTSKFQPVYVGDIGRLVEIISRDDPEINDLVSGKIIEAGGPDILTYHEIMTLVLKHTNRWRPIVSLPYAVGTIQGLVLEKLPTNIFTITRDQVEQLKLDNIVGPTGSQNVNFEKILRKYGNGPPKSVHEILPTYLKQ